MKKITVLGGGTGTFVVLSCLKKYPLDLGVIVTMMDSGGSTGRLRDQLGVLPPGDLRQCLVALSEAPILWRKLFLYRFESGDLAGHNFGNVFLSALEKVSKNYQEVIESASFVLKIKGQVIPVTFNKTNMCVKYKNGNVVKGEGNIDKNYQEKSKIVRATLEPQVEANPQALKRIFNSDYIIIGPGDIYTSIIPVLLVRGIKKALQESKAKIIYILNLMTKSGQTTGYKASDHLQDIVTYLGRTPNYIVANNGKIPVNILKWYLQHEENVVENDLTDKKIKIIIGDFIEKNGFTKTKSDVLFRSILRHDQKKLAEALVKIILC